MNTKPISLMMFSNSTVRAGVEEHILELLRGLDRSLFRLHLACPDELLEKFGDDIPKDVQKTAVMIDHLSDIRGAIRLARALRQQEIQILHSHTFRASLFASPIARLSGVPVVIETSHSCEPWRHGWLKSRYLIDRLAGSCVDSFIAVSSACARHLTENKKLAAGKVRVVHNGCNLAKYDPARPAPAEMRQSLGLPENAPVLVVLARLEPQKGHHVLLDAMPSVLREFSNAHLVCVGDGALRESLEKQAERLGIRDSVHFVGYQTNAPDWLALADFTVLPSYYEGLPLVAIESLAAGRTMVATAVDGTPDVVVDGVTGLTVPAGDSERMAEAICILLRDPSLRRTLADSGRRHVIEAFSSQKFIRETSQLYLDAWAQHLHHPVRGKLEKAGEMVSRSRS
jgi:glycosyltransferase involved in cell wall biosynthesis